MLVTLAFFSGDKPLAVNLANWINELSGVSAHDCLLVVDRSTDSKGVIEPLQKAFKSVTEIASEPAGPQGTWGRVKSDDPRASDATAANEMWLTGGIYIQHKLRRPWLWIETDVAPMRPTWIDEIEAHYQRGGRPFMGAFVNIPPFEPHMSGIGVYPPCVPDYSLDMAQPNKIAWDYAGRRDTVGRKKAHFSTLIQHEYRVHGKEPTFPTRDSLSIVKPGTALFHRCKDGSLTDRLREIRAEMNGASAIAEGMKTQSPLEAENLELRQRLERLELLLNKGGDEPCAAQPQSQSHSSILPDAAVSNVSASNGAPSNATTEAPRSPKKKMKAKRTLSPEHKAKLRASWEKRKAATA